MERPGISGYDVSAVAVGQDRTCATHAEIGEEDLALALELLGGEGDGIFDGIDVADVDLVLEGSRCARGAEGDRVHRHSAR